MESYNLTIEQEEELINQKFQELLDGYLASNHRKKVDIIERAFKFAKKAHQGIRRRSGEPYIFHPIEVARIVSQEIGLGSTSICAALLHDVVEDTEYTDEDMEEHFGKKIASIVHGLTKISGGIFGDKASEQAENFRKLLLTMAEDVRVILIKMADRLHNMRTLGSMLPSKQYKIAGETLYIYAPLAHRLGLFAIKTELEDLSFKFEHPELYNDINAQIKATSSKRKEIYTKFSTPIKKSLDVMGLKYEMKARVKSVYSIWNKMETKNIPFDQVYDLYAARIVFDCDNVADEKRICWNIYSEITDIYKLHPERTRDWISSPKANGYKALHVTVMGPDGNWIEVQIRSRRMDEMAERGFAAHWKYKIGEGDEESELAVWLKTIVDILNNPEPNALDFLDTIKLNLFASEIVVFTPKGELITLPKNASVLDVAFSLHSELGKHCIAGKVNHKLVPLSHKLESGDQVEVLTSMSQVPKPEWMNFMATAKGKTRLRNALRKIRKEVINVGELKLATFLKDKQLTLTNEVLTKILGTQKLNNREELCYKIGNSEIAVSDELLKIVNKGQNNTNDSLLSKIWRMPFGGANRKKSVEAEQSEDKININTKKTYTLISDDKGNSNYSIAECCQPVPGDDVFGFIDDDNNVIVHKRNCPTAIRLKSSFGRRILSTKWETAEQKFQAHISIEGFDRIGILHDIADLITGNLSLDIRKLNIETNDGVFNCSVVLLVTDTKEIQELCKSISRVKGVKTAKRIN
ncbi:MAG: RelA/SpoT family protein [Bacteroidales bacterium]